MFTLGQFTPDVSVTCIHAARCSVVPTAGVDGVRTEQSVLLRVRCMSLTFHL
jgi:hypothetical protein